MVFFSSRISPFTSTVILRDRSPRATAVVTSAMSRTCVVRLAARRLTLSVRSFQVPPTPGTTAWPPNRPSVPTSRATRVTSAANERSCSTIVLRVSFSSRISPRTSTVIFFDRSPPAMAVATSAMLRTCAVRLPGSEGPPGGVADAGHVGLATQSPFGTDLARHARHFAREAIELVDHRVQRFLELQDLAADVDRDLARQVAAGNGGRHLGDVANLRRQIA